MKRTDIKQMAFVAITTLLVASCASEDMTEGNQLPEGKYPVVIDAVNVSGNAQTRVSENADGSSSVFDWKGTEQIGVSINGKSAIYKLNTDNTISSEDPLYWSNTDVANVSARYPATDGTVDLSNQASGLAYVMTGTGTGNYANKVTLSFTHLLAKVRVVPDGNVKGEVTAVKIKTHQSCTLKDGALSTDGATIGFIAMQPATYDGVKCWEANVVPGYVIKDVLVTLNSGDIPPFELSTPVTPVAKKCHNVSVIVDRVVDLNSVEGDTYTVNDNVSIILDGKGTSLDKKLVIGTGATVVLRNVILEPIPGYGKEINTITCNNNATIQLSGTSVIKGARGENPGYGNGYAILINGGTLTIEGPGTLTAIGVGYEGAGIGAKNGANIVINGGIITASSSNPSDPGWGAPGIGSGSLGSDYCGNITINGGTITAQGAGGAAGIGTGTWGTCGDIVITGKSTVVNATKGANSPQDIGKGQDGNCGSITYSGGATVNGTKYE